MWRQVFCIFALAAWLLSTSNGDPGPGDQSVAEKVRETVTVQEVSSLPMAFTENRGQWDDSILFQSHAAGATVWFTRSGAYYQFTRRVADGESGLESVPADEPGRFQQGRDSLETIMIKAELVGSSPNPRVSGRDQMEYKCNYFIGDDPAGWHTDVPNYRAIVLEGVYPGIDLTYYGRGRRVEYDFRVSAGADHSRIRIKYQGIERLALADDGALVVTTAWGDVRELAPVVYQDVKGRRRSITSEYQINADSSFGFRLGPEFDSSLPVVIDPVLIYSTYLGGSNNDGGRSIAVDASGAVYVTGETFSDNFPTLNAYQVLKAGYINAFVTKLSAAGNSLVYSTYLGGSSSDGGYAVAVDAAGAAYVTGFASSTDFPVSNAYQGSYGGGSFDGFVTKLSSAGNALVYSTYLGGNNWDNGDGIAVDAAGAAYVTGYTSSPDFPTANPYQGEHQGDFDAYVAKFSSSGSSLVYSTYLGGSSADDGNSIAVDGSGSAYVTGRTRSVNFPTSNAYQGSRAGTKLDAFVTKLSGNGKRLDYSTYLGGAGDDYGYGITVDVSGAAYVTGRTRSPDFPTYNPYQGVNHGEHDVFVTKLSGSGASLLYSTFLGGAVDDYGYGIAVDAVGSAYVTGRAFSADFPTHNALQGTYQGGNSDAFVSRLSVTGSSLVFSTYLGGAMYDGGYGIAVGAFGAAYVTGYTDSDNFPTLYPYQGTLCQAGADIFVAKLTDTSTLDCCLGRVGDANGQGGDEPTISDISVIIDALFISGNPGIIACLAEADVNQSGGADPQPEDLTISDISILIDYLFISQRPSLLADCL